VKRETTDAYQFSLEKLITELNKKDPGKKVIFDRQELGSPDGVDSYRGYYRDLAIGFSKNTQCDVQRVTKELFDAIGTIFDGYKGGEYVMHESTNVWVANYGELGYKVIGVDEDESYVYLVTSSCVS